MKKITFNVSSQKDFDMASFIQEINTISCECFVNFRNNYVTVQNITEEMIDTVTEFIEKYYPSDVIDSMHIDNTTSALSNETITDEHTESKSDSEKNIATETDFKETASGKTLAEEQNADETKTEQPSPAPQSYEDLIVPKIEYKNEYLEPIINKFMKTASWTIFANNTDEKMIGNYLYSAMNVIHMSYYSEERIQSIKENIHIGDIVMCDFGWQLVGEINGQKVKAIVCKIIDNMVYLVPVAKILRPDISCISYLDMTIPNDATYTDTSYKGGVALVSQIKCVRIERIREVIGKTSSEFFKKLLCMLKSTFDFTEKEDTSYKTQTLAEKHNFTEVNEILSAEKNEDPVILTADENIISESLEEESIESENSADVTNTSPEEQEVESPVEQSEDSETSADTETESNQSTAESEPTKKVTRKKANSTTKDLSGMQEAMYQVIRPALEKLDESKTPEEQIDSFLTEIKLESSFLCKQAFLVSCRMNGRISNDSISAELNKIMPTSKINVIKSGLKSTFQRWINQHPDLKQKYPKMGIATMLKLFADKFA